MKFWGKDSRTILFFKKFDTIFGLHSLKRSFKNLFPYRGAYYTWRRSENEQVKCYGNNKNKAFNCSKNFLNSNDPFQNNREELEH